MTYCYRVKVSWWELVPPPAWIGRFWFTEMIWNLSVHRSCSWTAYHETPGPEMAQVAAYDYVTENMPGPQARVLVGRARRVKDNHR